MKRHPLARVYTALVLGLAAVIWIPAVVNAAEDQPIVSKTQTSTITGVIQEIDRGTREVAIKESSGNVFTLAVSEEAKNFDELQVGDEVSMEYTIGLTVALSPVREGTGTSRAEFSKFTEQAGKGDQVAGGKMTRYTTVVAVVEKLDPETRMVTLKGPNRTVTLAAGPDVDLGQVKEGDQVVAAIEQALAVNVTRTKRENKIWR
ncbi:MAG: hypothetical protein PVH31_02400 [Ectothiorhodospiraceae bacterium]|jgi:Cu/Ag efflux protein CusF